MVGHNSEQRSEGGRAVTEAVIRPVAQPWAWARHWEFWLALALGAFLRLWRLDLTQYLDDQTRLMTLARLSVTRGLIPLTGIPSSIHTLNPPLSVYLLLPFAALTSNPMPIVVSIALWNILGVALTYIITLRYFGRRLAAVSALLFATCGAAINYSRFIWQQNYLPPLIILWLLTLYLGCVEGRRRWFAGNVTLLALAALLHPIAALLAPVTLVGVALAPRLPRLRAWVVAALILALLALPTMLWEALSGFSDVRSARAFAFGHSKINLTVLYYLYQAISGPVTTGGLGVAFYGLNALATLLFAIGWLALTAQLLRPARALPWRRDAGMVAAVRVWSLALWRGLRADASWRVNLLLWLSVTLPPALMVRHSANLFAHYLMVLYPTGFIVSALGAVTSIRWLAAQVERRAQPLAATAVVALELALLALLLARSAQWLSVPIALTDAQTFNAYQDYGYPLSVLEGGAATLDQLQAQTGADGVVVITSANPRYQLAEQYILSDSRADRMSLTPSCLALPAADPHGWLVAPVTADIPTVTLLSHMSNALRIGTLPLLGGPAYPVYLVRGETPLQPGEIRLAPAIFDDHHGDRLRLLSASTPLPGKALLRWSLDSVSAPAGQTRELRVYGVVNGSIAYADCEPEHWRVGETLFTWLSVPANLASGITVHVETASNGLATPSLGALHFLSAEQIGAPLAGATLSVGPADPFQAAVIVGAHNELTIPGSALSGAP